MSAQDDASRLGKKLLKSSRDKNLKARTVVGRGEEGPLCDPMVDLSYLRDGAGGELWGEDDTRYLRGGTKARRPSGVSCAFLDR